MKGHTRRDQAGFQMHCSECSSFVCSLVYPRSTVHNADYGGKTLSRKPSSDVLASESRGHSTGCSQLMSPTPGNLYDHESHQTSKIVPRFEVLGSQGMRSIRISFCVVETFSVAMLVAIIICRAMHGKDMVQHHIYIPCINTAVGALLTAVLAAAVMPWLKQVLKYRSNKEYWTRQRMYQSGLTLVELTAAICGLAILLSKNVYVLIRPCAWYTAPVTWLYLAAWFNWNIIFFCSLAKARNTNLWLAYDGTPLGSRPDATMIEAPVVRTHTVGLCLWCAVAVVLILQVVLFSRRGDVDGFVNHIEQNGDQNCHNWEYDCYFGHEGRVTVALTFAGLGLYVLLFFAFLTTTFRQLRGRPSREHHTAHVYARTTLHQRALGMNTFVLCFIGYTAINFDSCASRYLTLLGLLPIHVVFVSTVAWGLFYDTPVDESMQIRAQQVSALQLFAWSEDDKGCVLDERARRVPSTKAEPMFCFQTCVNMWYFSALVYRYKQAIRAALDQANQPQVSGLPVGSPSRRLADLPPIIRTASIASSAAEGLQKFSGQDSISERSDSNPSSSGSMPLGITRAAIMGLSSNPTGSLPANFSRAGIRDLQAEASMHARDSESDTASQADSVRQPLEQGQAQAADEDSAQQSSRPLEETGQTQQQDDPADPHGESPQPGRLQKLMRLLRPARRKAGPADDDAVVMCCGCLDNEWADGQCKSCRFSGFQMWLQSVCDLFSCDFCLEVRNPSKGEEDMLTDLAPAELQRPGSMHYDPSSPSVPASPFAANRTGAGSSGRLSAPADTSAETPATAGPSGLGSLFSAAPATTMRARRRSYERRARRKQKQDFLLDLALSLYDLHRLEVFWARQKDVHALIAWGRDTAVVAFRGTASLANIMTDLKIWNVPHPPKRGSRWLNTQPRVHGGFLQSWVGNGLSQQIMQHLTAVIAKSASEEGGSATAFKIYVTGHSLGGALAFLAAHDIQLGMRDAPIPVGVSCYTFGAPRPGNHAFAAAINTVVPDTWSVVNDQDAVTRQAKFLTYKRGGQRVLINSLGNMVVRPSYVELSIHNRPGASSVGQHYLSSYRASMAAVCRAQLDEKKRLAGGLRGFDRLMAAASLHTILAPAGKMGDDQDDLPAWPTLPAQQDDPHPRESEEDDEARYDNPLTRSARSSEEASSSFREAARESLDTAPEVLRRIAKPSYTAPARQASVELEDIIVV